MKRSLLPVVQGALPLVALWLALNTSSITPNDVWWHMRMGGLVLAEGHVPTVDIFSFTRAGEPWVNQAWLMQVQYFLAERFGGDALVLFVHALLVTSGYAAVSLTTGARAGRRHAAVATLFGMIVGSLNWAVRPQAFSFLAFGVVIAAVEAHRCGRRRALAWLVPLFALWSNCHGGFVFGLLLLALYAGGVWVRERALLPRVARGPLVALATAILATAMNPQGIVGLARYVVGFVRSAPTLQLNEEFQRMHPFQHDGALFFGALALLAWGIARRPKRLPLDRVVTLVVFAALAFVARRNAAWFGMALIPSAADLLAAEAPSDDATAAPPRRALYGALLVAFGLGSLAALPWWRGDLRSDGTPERAMAFLCAEADGDARVFQEETFGVYQIWRCPKLPVFIDTRYELYPMDQWRAYVAVSGGDRAAIEAVAQRHHLSHFLFSTATQPRAIATLTRLSGWSERYRDERAVLFARNATTAAFREPPR